MKSTIPMYSLNSGYSIPFGRVVSQQWILSYFWLLILMFYGYVIWLPNWDKKNVSERLILFLTFSLFSSTHCHLFPIFPFFHHFLFCTQRTWTVHSSSKGCFSPLSDLLCRFCTLLFWTLFDFLLTGVGGIWFPCLSDLHVPKDLRTSVSLKVFLWQTFSGCMSPLL